MGTSAADRQLHTRIAGGYFDGLDAAEIARRLGASRAAVDEALEALEAVLILIAHEVPEVLLARAARLPAEAAAGWLREIRARLESVESVRAFIAAHPAVTAPRGSGTGGQASPPDEDAAPSADAEQALAVLDFWASKWL